MIRSRALLAPLAALAACTAAGIGSRQGSSERNDERDTSPDVASQGAARSSPQDALLTIARLEDARSDGGGLLQIMIGRSEPQLRARAAMALGRLPTWRWREEVTRALVAALDDPEPQVRAAAAFGLGMRADPSAEEAILAHLDDELVEVRARLVEAASKIATPKLQRALLERLDDPAVPVRIEAAQGIHRFPDPYPADAPSAAEVDEVLIGQVRRGRLPAGGRTEEVPEEPDVVWRALFSLSRRASTSALDLFSSVAADTDAHRLSRFFSLKGLGALAKPEAQEEFELRSVLEQVAKDPDAVLAAEALRGLARLADPASLEVLEEVLGSATVQLRALACEAASQMASASEQAAALIEERLDDPAPSVRRAALVGATRLRGPALLEKVLEASHNTEPVGRHAAAQAAAHLDSESALPILLRLSADEDLFVASAAVAALESHVDPAATERLADLLEGEDNGLRLGAALVLRSQGLALGTKVMQKAWELSLGDGGSEVRVELLRLAESSDSFALQNLLPLALRDPDPHVRNVASELGAGQGAILADARYPGAGGVQAEAAQRAAAGGNPTVELRTSRGTMVFELFASEAPLHVHSFLELAERGYYDGLTIHRVVPGFVIQGGCYRGDGNGGGDWRGSSLRHEIGPRKYRAGSLGMPRWEDLESGGSQFFVTHLPTPHLDGRYTIFGELRSGFDVLDTIEVGDLILGVQRR